MRHHGFALVHKSVQYLLVGGRGVEDLTARVRARRIARFLATRQIYANRIVFLFNGEIS